MNSILYPPPPVSAVIGYLRKEEEFEWVNETIEIVNHKSKTRSRKYIVTSCVLKLKGHDEFYGTHVEASITDTLNRSLRGDELHAIRLARLNCLREIKKAFPGYIEGLIKKYAKPTTNPYTPKNQDQIPT